MGAQLGEDLFWECVGHYLRRHANGSDVTDDLRRAIEDVTGRNLEWFFDQWVHHGGHSVLRVTTKREKKGLAVTVEQTQKRDDMTPLFRFAVGVRIKAGRRFVERRLEIRETRQTFHLDL